MSAEPLLRLMARKWFVLGVSLGLFFICAWSFAKSQEIWVDEATQLSGLTLDPIAVVRWLAGEDRQRFGVPGDRMPPLSYWLGWGWSQVFGLSENSLRALGIVAVGTALGLIIDTAWEAFGKAAAWIAGLWFALAPTVLTLSAEVRAYPFLVLGAATACWGLHRLATVPQARAWSAFAVIGAGCLASSYCHFFGVVLFGASTVGASYFVLRRRLHWGGPLGLIAGFSVGAAGLVPFVFSAVEMSQGEHPASSVAGVAQGTGRLVYRVFGGHPAMSIFPALAVVGVLSAVACVLFAACQLLSRNVLFGALCAALVSGLCAVGIAQFVLKGFDAASVSYNSWMLPFATLLVGASAGNAEQVLSARAGRWLSRVATCSLAVGAALLLSNSSVYAHGASERVAARLNAAGPAEIAVLHEQAGDWGFMYFPLRFEFATLPQYLVARSSDESVLLTRVQQDTTPAPLSDLAGRKVALLSTHPQRFPELAAYVRTGHAQSFTPPELGAALSKMGCQVSSNEIFVATMTTELSWFQCK